MASSKKTNQVALMRTKGFMPATEVSTKLGNDIATIYRWADSGKVVGMQVGRARYVEVISLVNHLGVDVARIFGIITEDQARAITRAKAKSATGKAAER